MDRKKGFFVNIGFFIGGIALLAIFFSPALGAEPPGSGKLLPRAYEGAPPLIPHDIEGLEGACLTCHFEGAAGAPIVPHPDRLRCQQCHVTQDLTVKPFKESTFKRR